ncbi:MAG: hypothetical protein IKS69_03625 [Erysipelotrichaceae bacterium]|nr:hypothetical protein [Erysipelotrichaceae bacterium]
MKKKILIILTLLLMFAACSKKSAYEEKKLSAFYDETHDVTLMSEIANGDRLPTYIHYFVANSVDGTIIEEDMIRIVCEELSKLDLVVSEPHKDIHIDDGAIYFSMFFEDGDYLNLYFETSAYYVAKDGTYYPVKETSILQRLMKDIPDHLIYDYDFNDPDASTDSEKIAFLGFADGKFSWDGDLDGEEEAYVIEYNEKDAQISIYPEADPDSKVIIDKAYEIKAIESRTDNKGNFLLIRYTTGDAENHNNLSSIVYRFDDGEPTVK